MGMWQTGYMEFHDPAWPTLAGKQVEYVYVPPPPPVYPCVVCGTEFASKEELSNHRIESHPARHPALRLLDREALSFPMRNVISTPLSAAEVDFQDATSANVDGVEMLPAKLGRYLAKEQSGIKLIVLTNGTLEKRYELKFEIAEPVELTQVDRAFFDLITQEVTVGRIQDFAIRTRDCCTALRYVEGLAQYLYGKLAKERSGDTHIRFEDYRQRYNQSIDALRGFTTPLSRTIVGLVNCRSQGLNHRL